MVRPDAVCHRFERNIRRLQAGTRCADPASTPANMSLGKDFHLFENAVLQFRADASNVFNHPNFDVPDGNFNDPVNLSTPDRPQGAGTISATTVGGRTMQISAHLAF